jgi:hypothetical protein
VSLRPLYYIGIINALTALLQGLQWCRDHAKFDAGAERHLPHSLFASPRMETLYKKYIPGYEVMNAAQQEEAVTRFVSVGQTCSEPVLEVALLTELHTMLLVLEGGSDAFRPFIKRDWSTTVFGYRVLNMPWWAASSDGNFVIVAIISGPKEALKFGSVIRLLGEEARELQPPVAQERGDTDDPFAGGVPYPMPIHLLCFVEVTLEPGLFVMGTQT